MDEPLLKSAIDFAKTIADKPFSDRIIANMKMNLSHNEMNDIISKNIEQQQEHNHVPALLQSRVRVY